MIFLKLTVQNTEEKENSCRWAEKSSTREHGGILQALQQKVRSLTFTFILDYIFVYHDSQFLSIAF